MAFSSGKVIITGEHSVVYGQPALVSSIDKGVKISLQKMPLLAEVEHNAFIQNVYSIFEKETGIKVSNLTPEIKFELPIGSGLGSSAALAHALFKELICHFSLVPFSIEKMIELVQESEKFAHQNPSGVDTIAVVVGGLLQFQKKDGTFNYSQLKKIRSKKGFLLINSGKPKETTKEMVEFVQKRVKSNVWLEKVITEMGELSRQVIEDFENDVLNPALLHKNNIYLDELGVIGKKAQHIIKEIEHMDGIAKVTGAGGVAEGSGMLLAYHENIDQLKAFTEKKKWDSFKVIVG